MDHQKNNKEKLTATFHPVLGLVRDDIDKIPTEKEARRLLGEAWNLECKLEHISGLLRKRRKELWRQENAELIKQHEADVVADKILKYLKFNQFSK